MYKDKIDERIIGYLKEDSRESFVDIGKKLKLSESAVRRRVKNLVDSKTCLLYTSPSPRDRSVSRMPSSA